jgi:uncharacterized Zn finger protein
MSDVLVRVGNREGAQQKGRRYLLEGRVRIRYVGPQGVRAYVRGQGEIYRVEYGWGRWSCTCPAKGRCCHLVAVQLVVAVGDA